MKSKETILEEFGCPAITFSEEVTMYYPAILNAMTEFADQETVPLKSEIERLKRKIDNLERMRITGSRI